MNENQYVEATGWLTVANATGLRRLIEKHDIKTVLDIGTFLGLSAMIFAAAGCQVTTVDTFRGGSESYLKAAATKKKIEHQLQIVKGNLAAFGMLEKVRIIEGTSFWAANLLKHEMSNGDQKFDMIYIDASHVYEDVKSDIECLMPICGKVICGDDYTDAWPGVKRAVDEMIPDADRSKRLWHKLIV